jgi:hypothetical protein
MVDMAMAGEGFYACHGIGCDMVVESRGQIAHSSTPLKIKSRCGETPCAWLSYRHMTGGVVLGVRVCADHVPAARDEERWIRFACGKEVFSVWEVMTG